MANLSRKPHSTEVMPKPSRRNLGDLYLTRADYPGSRGYWSRPIMNGVQHSKWFGVSSCGSFDAAKEAARKYRDDFIRRNKIDRSTVGLRYGHRSRFKSTPPLQPTGISLALVTRDDGSVEAAWKCQFRVSLPSGERKSICHTRSIHRYGYVNAYRLSCKIRSKATGLRIVGDPPPRRVIADQLRRRLGKKWRSVIFPRWEDWWS